MDSTSKTDLIKTLGELIGVLGSGSGFDLNTSWFSNPFGGTNDLTTILTNSDQTAALFELLGDVLTPSAHQPAEPGGDVTWYDIPNPNNGTPTGACLIAPNNKQNSGNIGLGAVHDTQIAGLSVTLYVYQALVSIDPTNAPSQILTSNYPKVGIQVNNSSALTYGTGSSAASAETISLEGTLDPTAPDFTLTFVDGSSNTPFTSISDLIAKPNYIGLLCDEFLQTTMMQHWLNKYVGVSKTTYGDMLEAAGLLNQSGPNNTVYTLDSTTISGFEGSATTIIERLVYAALMGLTAVDPLIPLEGGGISVVQDGAGGLFGLNIQIPDLILKHPSAESQKELLLQLGSWLTAESDTDNWLTKSGMTTPTAGINVYFIKSTSAPSFSLESPTVKLTSVGVDYKGTDSKHPLFDIKGLTMQGAEARIYLDTNLSAVEQFGAAIRLDEIGIPLGPPAGTNNSSNPVAGNILSSGAGTPDSNNTASAAVNPSFSIVASYLGANTNVPGSKPEFNFQLYDAEGKPTDTIWLPLQRTFGPLKCQKIGIGWQESTKDLLLIFDGSIELGAIDVTLIDLSIGFPITNPTDTSAYELGLKGMSLLYEKGDVRISGGFLESGSGSNTVYNGEVIIDAGNFGLGALGSYGQVNGHTSLFIFGSSTTPLGGPPAFFVDGIAAGFGYNRKLIAPAKNQVASFPLVAAASNPSAVGLSSGGSVNPDQLAGILSTFDSSVPVSIGEYWLAAGVKFKTFDLVNSNVLLAVLFGKEFEILILGTSLVQLPPPPDNADVFASAELELEVIILPDKGNVEATAVLSPNSFVLTPDCHLTGGFAFYTWFGDNPHAGDFVLSLGGYNSAFNKPAWYPSVQRLGFLWQISSDLDIQGDAYFALTPSCVMGGGSLTASFHMGSFLQAWYTTHADFVMTWKPFSYYIEMGVSIGVRANVPLLFVTLHITISVGATIQIWGPSTGGAAHVHLWFASFTIAFGPGRGSVPHTVDWASVASMLPKSGVYATDNPPSEALFAAEAEVASSLSTPSPGPVIVINDGLIKNEGDTWIVRGADFVFSTTSNIPCSSIEIGGAGENSLNIKPVAGKPQNVNVRPLNIENGTCEFTITLSATPANPGDPDLSYHHWVFESAYADLADAVFGAPLPKGATPAPSADQTSYMIGLNNITPKSHIPSGPPAIDMKTAFKDVPVILNSSDYPNLPLSAQALPEGETPSYTPNAFADIANIYNGTTATSAQTNRDDLVTAFGELGLYEGTGGTLTNVAASPQAVFQNAPMID